MNFHSFVGNHRLPIETGRWHGIDHGNRLCNICTDAKIGDEFHYILQCKSLINERKLFLSQYFFMQNIIKQMTEICEQPRRTSIIL
jgi:hypothetical protein